MPGLPGTPGYPVRMATPIPAASTSTDANGVAHYPGAYVFAEPDPYPDPYPFTTADVEFDFSPSAQSPESLHLAYTAAAASTSTAVPRLPEAESLSPFADAVVWAPSARRDTVDLEKSDVREEVRPRLPRLTIPDGEDGQSNESLLSQPEVGMRTATRQEESEKRPQPQSQAQSQPKPKVESGYGPESASGSGHAQNQGQGQSQGQRNRVGRGTSFMGSLGAGLLGSASASRAAEGNQKRLPDSTFHPERRGPQRESSWAKLSPFRLFGKGRARSSSQVEKSDEMESPTPTPNMIQYRNGPRDLDCDWIWNHQAKQAETENARRRGVSVSSSMSAPAVPTATAIGPASASGYERNYCPTSAFAGHQRFFGIDGNPTGYRHGHGYAHSEGTVGLGLRDSSPAQHAPPTTYPAALSTPSLSATRTTVRPV